MSCLPPLPPILDPELRVRVATHRSYILAQAGLQQDQEEARTYDRLAFLGDAIFTAAVSKYLYDNFPLYRVGPYTIERTTVVRKDQLAQWAVAYGLVNLLQCHGGNRFTIVRSIDVQASLFQAYVGAVFQEGGVSAVTDWIGPLIRPYIKLDRPKGGLEQDEGTIEGSDSMALSPPVVIQTGYLPLLNEYMQKIHSKARWIESSTGPAHLQHWHVEVYDAYGGMRLAEGSGSRKQGAKEDAARKALEVLKNRKVSPVRFQPYPTAALSSRSFAE